MFYFIVSGYIPGTDIQISFDMLVVFVMSFAAAFGLFLLVRATLKSTLNLADTIQNLDELAL